MTALLAASLLLSTNATPAELVASCRSMLPADAELEGRIVLRSRKGIAQAEYGYVLRRHGGETDLKIVGPDGKDVPFSKEGCILATDVTWSDLSLDYLWWDDFSFDAEREGETVHGQVCAVVAMRRGDRTVRVWVDRKTGALMQAEELRDGRPVRRLWGARIKKFGDRWMANVLEVETMGSGHRTKITVEKLK
ncbi:MAG: outer membrane lipoprotein-sorting protein [Kiritimatiellae bacterium]|nr:outer membrane lipoprotein-sorting protein [Kiritimatiellia bacterium]